MSTARGRSWRPPLTVAAAFDAAVLLAFVVGGRANHDEGITLTGVLVVLWPFAVGWFGAAIATGLWRDPGSVRGGAIAWAVGMPVAFALRALGGREVDVAFVIVASLFTLAGLVGWRAAVRLVRGSGERHASG